MEWFRCSESTCLLSFTFEISFFSIFEQTIPLVLNQYKICGGWCNLHLYLAIAMNLFNESLIMV
jgi:hypothetical protein